MRTLAIVATIDIGATHCHQSIESAATDVEQVSPLRYSNLGTAFSGSAVSDVHVCATYGMCTWRRSCY